MFWCCFRFSGVGTLAPIEGMMNSARYTELIQPTIIRDMQRAFPEGGGIFQQDLAPCHTSQQVKRVFRQADIKVLDWPGNSPDLNPIKNLWSILKSRLLKLNCTTKTKLERPSFNYGLQTLKFKKIAKRLFNPSRSVWKSYWRVKVATQLIINTWHRNA